MKNIILFALIVEGIFAIIMGGMIANDKNYPVGGFIAACGVVLMLISAMALMS